MGFVILWLLSILAIFAFSVPSLREALQDQRDTRAAGLNGRYIATAGANVRREALRLVCAILMLCAWLATLFLAGDFADVAIFGYASFLVAIGVVMAAQSFLDRQWRKTFTRPELDRAIRENTGPQRREGDL